MQFEDLVNKALELRAAYGVDLEKEYVKNVDDIKKSLGSVKIRG